MLDVTAVVTVLVVGLVAGWIAHLIMGAGTPVRDLVTGFFGALVGTLLVNGFGVPLPFGNALFSDVVISVIGAVVVIAIARTVAWRSRAKLDSLQ
jgi:uncharacterized membrane protein YeaQ/YmgE (transglycosylase-associated protein family)